MKRSVFIAILAVLLFSLYPGHGLSADDFYKREARLLDDLRSAVDQHGPRSYNTAPFRMQLADFYIAEEEYHKAEPLLHQVRRMMEARLGMDHVQLMPVLEKLAALDARQHRYKFALNLYNRALGIAKRNYGSNSAQAKSIGNAIAGARRDSREWKRLGRRMAAPAKSRTPPIGAPITIKPKLPSRKKMGVAAAKTPKKPQKVAKKSQQQAKAKKPDRKAQKASTAAGGRKAQVPAVRTVAAAPVVEKQKATAAASAAAGAAIAMNLDAEGIPRDPGAANKIGYYISMGCFSDKNFAVGQVKRVMALPLPVYMKSIRNNTMHCVFGGPFATHGAAVDGAERSRNEARVRDTLVKKY